MSRPFTAYGYLALAMVLAGSTVVAGKIIAVALPPFTASALRFAIATPVLVLLMRLCAMPWPKPDRRDTLLLLAQAGAGSVGYTVLLLYGLGHTSATDAGIMAGTLPAVATLMAIILFGERPGKRQILLIALSALGAMALNDSGTRAWRFAPSHLAGNGLILLAVICECLFIQLNKRLTRPVPPLALATLMCLTGFLLTLGPGMAQWQHAATPSVTALRAALWAVLYYALGPTVAGFYLWYAGSERVDASRAAPFTALLPIAALACAALWLREAVSPAQGIASAAIVAAIALNGMATRHTR